jgi:hypothetical protein
VPQDLFDRVQEKIVRNKKAPARHKAEDDYILTTKLYCGTCGAMMVGECGTSASRGQKYHYYRCINSKKRKTCTAKHKAVRKVPIENAVINAVMVRIMDDNFVDYVADEVMRLQETESGVLPALRKQLEEIERGINNMINAIQSGIITESTKRRLEELEAQKKNVELEITREEIKHPIISHADVVWWLCRFRNLDVNTLEARKQLIDSFVHSVVIYDDYILITFNYSQDGEVSIPLSSLESSNLSSVARPPKRRKSFDFRLFSLIFVPTFIRRFSVDPDLTQTGIKIKSCFFKHRYVNHF